MAKRPAEVFGFSIFDSGKNAKDARVKHWCPFVDEVCFKQSRLIDYPMGVCSVEYGSDIVAICPRRFLEKQKVFEEIADKKFGSRDNLVVFSEVRLESVGTFDFVMVKHKPMSTEVEDFAVIEFQTGQTTGTGKLVQGLKDVMAGDDLSGRSYAFGLNIADVWKRSFTQVLNKGIVLEAWERSIYWVVQEEVLGYLLKKYHLDDMGLSPEHSTVFLTYQLTGGDPSYSLVKSHLRSASIDSLFLAFRNNPVVTSRMEFEKVLTGKLYANLGFRLGLHTNRRLF